MDARPGGFVVPAADHVHSQSSSDKSQLSSKQEGKLIHYIDQKFLDISRMYKRRAVEDSDQAIASEALDQLLGKIEAILQILKQVPSRSASLVVAYALGIIDLMTDYVRVFDRSPTSTFGLIQELDDLFIHLIQKDVISLTEKTRLNALAARLRDAMYTKYEGSEQYEARLSEVFEKTISSI